MSEHVPLISRRTYLIQTFGTGTRPCIDGANNWLGCTHCDLPCILSPWPNTPEVKPATPLPAPTKKRKAPVWWRVSAKGYKRHRKAG